MRQNVSLPLSAHLRRSAAPLLWWATVRCLASRIFLNSGREFGPRRSTSQMNGCASTSPASTIFLLQSKSGLQANIRQHYCPNRHLAKFLSSTQACESPDSQIIDGSPIDPPSLVRQVWSAQYLRLVETQQKTPRQAGAFRVRSGLEKLRACQAAAILAEPSITCAFGAPVLIAIWRGFFASGISRTRST